MAYSLTIERPDNPITLEEWTEAIESIDCIRLSSSDHHTTQNPATGEAIALKAVDGDAEIFDAENMHNGIRLSCGAIEAEQHLLTLALLSEQPTTVTSPIQFGFASRLSRKNSQRKSEEKRANALTWTLQHKSQANEIPAQQNDMDVAMISCTSQQTKASCHWYQK